MIDVWSVLVAEERRLCAWAVLLKNPWWGGIFLFGDPISLHVFGKDLNGVSYSLVP